MKIEVHSNFCKLLGGSREEFNWLRDTLTVDVPGAKYTMLYRRKQWDGKKRFFNYVSGTFPIGFLGLVINKAQDRPLTLDDKRKVLHFDPTLPTLKGVTIRDYQEGAIRKCIDTKNCIVQAATNAGKTLMFAALLKQMKGLKCLIITHRDELLWQLKEMVEGYTGLALGVIAAKEVQVRPCTIAMVTTLANRIGVDEKITTFFESVDCVIVDEAHHCKAKTYQNILSACKAVYRFGFSGTIAEENTMDGMLMRAWLGDVVCKVTNDHLIQAGVSAKPLVHIYQIDSSARCRAAIAPFVAERKKLFGELQFEDNPYKRTQLQKEIQRLNREVYQTELDVGVVKNPERNGKVLEILKANEGKSALLVVDLIEHGRILEKLLKDHKVNCAFMSGQAGEEETRRLALSSFKAGMLRVLISSNIIDEGIDISRIEVLIMLAGKKSKRQYLQRVGRGLRRKDGVNELKLYDFADFGTKYLESHSKQRIKLYKDENFDIEVLDS